MAVSLVDRRVGGQAVEVALALDVLDPDAFGLSMTTSSGW